MKLSTQINDAFYVISFSVNLISDHNHFFKYCLQNKSMKGTVTSFHHSFIHRKSPSRKYILPDSTALTP